MRCLPADSLLFAHAPDHLEAHLMLRQIGVDDDVVAVQYLAVEDLHGQRVLNQALDGTLERASAVGRIVTFA